jgi:hypothetical protein
MKVISFLWAMTWPLSIFGCELKTGHNYYSLSGPITMLLEHFEILENQALKGISVFHPVEKYSGNRIGGGIFLSPKAFADEKALVFYDESQELRRSLNKIPKLHLISIATRGLDVFEATSLSLKTLTAYLKGCEEKIAKLEQLIQQVQIRINQNDSKVWNVLFFMQMISASLKYPSMLIVQDGFVLTMLKANRIKTYDSPLAYVAWSSKKLSHDYKHYQRLGLNETMDKTLKVSRYDDLNYNVFYRGIFTPGIRQLFFLDELLKIKEKRTFEAH